jgi:hypothetical protein
MMNQYGMQLNGPMDDGGIPGSGQQQMQELPPGEEGQEQAYDDDGYSAQESGA